MAPTLDCELIWLGQSLRSDFLLFPDFTHTVFHHSVVLSGIFLFVAQWVFHHLVYLQLSVVESNILLPFCQNWRQIFIENDPLRLENLTFSLVEETVVAFSCGTLSYSSTDGKRRTFLRMVVSVGLSQGVDVPSTCLSRCTSEHFTRCSCHL